MRATGLSLLLVLLALSSPTDAAVPETFATYPGRSYRLAAPFNESPFVYAATDSGGVMAKVTGAMYPFLEPESATILSVEAMDNGGLEIVFVSTSLGNVTLEIVHDRPSRLVTPAEADAVLALVTEDPTRARIVGTASSPLVHYAGCNHAPRGVDTAGYESVAQAAGAGKRACPVCFAGVSPIPDLAFELTLGRLTARELGGSYRPTTHPEKQQLLNAAGEKVLAGWPAPLRGYSYEFELVSMGSVNALACPGGRIFFSEELFDMCESPLELECVLAHEIAHVEMRHGYRDYRKTQQKAGWGAVLGAAVGVATAKSTSDGVAAGAVLAVAGAKVAMELAFSGYRRDREEESDFFAAAYLVAVYGEAARAEMSRTFRKLDYYQEIVTGERDAYNAFASHPTLSKRIDYVDNVRIIPLGDQNSYVVRSEAGDIVLRIELRGLSAHEWMAIKPIRRDGSAMPGEDMFPELEYHRDLRCFGYAKASNALATSVELKDIWFDYGEERLKLDNKEDTELAPGQTVSFYVYCEKKSTGVPITIGDRAPDHIELSAGKTAKYVLMPETP